MIPPQTQTTVCRGKLLTVTSEYDTNNWERGEDVPENPKAQPSWYLSRDYAGDAEHRNQHKQRVSQVQVIGENKGTPVRPTMPEAPGSPTIKPEPPSHPALS
jgi:hypothetical protein